MSEQQPPEPERPAGERPEAPPPGEEGGFQPPRPEWVAMPQSPPPHGAAVPGHVNATRRGADERRAILAQQLQQAAARHLRVESSTEYQAVLVQGKPVNHTLHAILTIFTCLMWGIVWIILAATGGEKRHQLIVDEFGNVHWQNLGRA
jgi:hypothetical protein